ncbi:MAG TPA: 2-oxoglutarate dehydrogenase E1 component [Kofleriaceae bacterium]|nr:2-oxoglutarate dehydrogenase E1 component [Kofleriaceae bacterium]
MAFDPVVLGANLSLVDEMYARYLADHASVDPYWRQLFSNGVSLPTPSRAAVAQAVVDTRTGMSTWPLVNAHRVRGHMLAHLDPLDLMERPHTIELEASTYGFADADLDREFPAGGFHGVDRATLQDLLARLRATYSGSIGLEFMHISAPEKKRWLARKMELESRPPDRDTKRAMLEKLLEAAVFERFCHSKYPGTKRFSIEGAETLLPLLDLVLLHAARLGAVEAVIGMAHRGRLNVLVNLLDRAPRDLFAEFYDIEPEATLGGGDVKYHLGWSCDRVDRAGHPMHLSLAFNPSHLEAVDPVVCGRVRAKQRRAVDWEHQKVLGLLVHGDAAFAGQGLVAETLQLSGLHGYKTGGTVHVVVNNQIGFTASPQEARSTPYCTDIAKMIQCPIWHVNGEDLDAVAKVVVMAMEYRALFKSDVVIDMYCYRKYGHNEMDEPSFTQPVMYRRIQDKRPIDEIYGGQLIGEGLITAAEIEAIRDRHRGELEGELEAARAAARRPEHPHLRGIWSGYEGGPERVVAELDTGVPRARLTEVGERMCALPDGFNAHPKVRRLLQQRVEMARGERPLDWGMAEMLAYGTLIWNGTLVRMTGQDSSRGTFSHRHAVVTDIDNGAEHNLLAHLHPAQGEARIYDSPLSEAGVLGYEFGYSLDYPDGLVVWEAQFGDFANGAQVIIDQFIVASEDKWKRLSGLVMLLPHGFEGQGPEHSSARLERYLEGCAEDNIQVAQPTTPAQVFHLLRRQVVRPWRKPLIVLTPKSLLRLPAAVSALDELERGRFRRVLGDPEAPPAEQVERVFMCTGKLFYELAEERKKRDDRRTAIVRIEQLYPWRAEELRLAVSPYVNARDFVWVQDEPANMGAWNFMAPRLTKIFGSAVRRVSRPESASPATGSPGAHELERAMLMKESFDGR